MKLKIEAIPFEHIKLMLSLVGNKITVSDDETIRLIFEVFAKEEILSVVDHRKTKWWPMEYTVENIKNLDSGKSYIKAISTFRECRESIINYAFDEQVYYCELKIYEGDNFTGYREGLRVVIKFRIPEEYIRMDTIKKYIYWKYCAMLEDAYTLHLEAQKELWQMKQHELLMSVINPKPILEN